MFGLGIGSLGGTGQSGDPLVPMSSPTLTFDYLPSRDGLALLTGGPTLAGYAANAAANPSRKWAPRFVNGASTDVAKGGLSEGDSFDSDPEYAWSNGWTPFLIDGNGNLVIRARKVANVAPAFAGGEIPTNPGTAAAYTWITGTLVSDSTFRQYGGYWEIDCKFNTTKAVWPSFWLLNDYSFTKRAEIDIIERPGIDNGPSAYNTNAITSEDGSSAHSALISGPDMGAGFHKYGALITDTQIKFYLDRVLVRTLDSTFNTKFNEAYFMLLSNLIGSNIPGWVGHPDGTTTDPADMTVRSVRVWQANGPISMHLSASSYLDSAAVGDTVATINAGYFGADSALVFSIASDPDAMFSIDNSSPVVSGGTVSVPLKLAQVVLATADASHDVTIKATDAAGRTFQRKFTIGVITATPIQANYVTVQDLTNAYWVKNLVTTTATQVMETAASGQHVAYASNKTRAAGVKTFRFYMEVEGVGRSWMKLQLFSGAFGADQAISNFDLANVATGFSTVAGGWSNCVPFIIPIPGTNKLRIGMDFTTDGTSTNVTISPQIQPDSATNSYLGDVTKGMKITSTWLYNKAAGAGGS